MVGVTLNVLVVALLGAGVLAMTSPPTVLSAFAPAVSGYRSAVTSPPFQVAGALADVAVVQSTPTAHAEALVLGEVGQSWRVDQRITLDGAGELARGHFAPASPHAPEWLTPVVLRGGVHAVLFDELDAGGWSGVVLASRHGKWGVARVSGWGTTMLANPRLAPPGSLATSMADCHPNCAAGGFVDRRFRFDPSLFAFRSVGLPRHVAATAAPRLPGRDA